MTDGKYTCGEHSVTYRDGESLCSTLETSNIMCQLSFNKKLNKKKEFQNEKKKNWRKFPKKMFSPKDD